MAGLPGPGAVPPALLTGLVGATLAGTVLGFPLRRWIAPARVVGLVRIVAAGAALVLAVSLLR